MQADCRGHAGWSHRENIIVAIIFYFIGQSTQHLPPVSLLSPRRQASLPPPPPPRACNMFWMLLRMIQDISNVLSPPSHHCCHCKPPLLQLVQAVSCLRLICPLPSLIGCHLSVCCWQAEEGSSCVLSSCIAACHALHCHCLNQRSMH